MRLFTYLSWLIFLCCAFFLCFRWLQFTRDVEAVAHRAQVSANAEDMLGYMEQYQFGLSVHGMTQGNTAIFFKTPANDLALLSKTVTRIIDRLKLIEGVAPTEVLYQVALGDIRGTIRELESPSLPHLCTQYWYLLLAMALAIIWIKLDR